MRKSALPSPFRDAAEALDRELERYATLARQLGPEPVHAALYFPLLGRLIEVPLD